MARICEHMGLSHSKQVFAAHRIYFVENHFIDGNKSESFPHTLGKFEESHANPKTKLIFLFIYSMDRYQSIRYSHLLNTSYIQWPRQLNTESFVRNR